MNKRSKSILDLFGHFTENEIKLEGIGAYLFLLTHLISEKGSIKKRDLITTLKNNIWAMRKNEEDEEIIEYLEKMLSILLQR